MRTNRQNHEMRDMTITANYTEYADSSILITYGKTKVICTAFFEQRLPEFLQGKNSGWLTAEYNMLPSASPIRIKRDIQQGKMNGRASEIQRLIGRSLRACLNLELLYPYTIQIDCDVIQADGGTRTASITGAFIALMDCIQKKIKEKVLLENPIQYYIGAISVGIIKDTVLCDLQYSEDAIADTDLNVIMNDNYDFIEIQGNAEKKAFTEQQLSVMLQYAKKAITHIIDMEKVHFNHQK